MDSRVQKLVESGALFDKLEELSRTCALYEEKLWAMGVSPSELVKEMSN